MALGKNIKIDKLIPAKEEEKVNEPQVQDEGGKKNEKVQVEAVKETPIEQSTDGKEERQEPKQKEVSSQNGRPVPDDIVELDLSVEFKPSKRKTQKRIIVTIKGDISVKNIHLLKEKVPFIFEHYDFVEVKLQEITAIDVAALQLFHLMRVLYGHDKKFVAINAEFTDEQQQLLTACGFTEFHTQIKARA